MAHETRALQPNGFRFRLVLWKRAVARNLSQIVAHTGVIGNWRYLTAVGIFVGKVRARSTPNFFLLVFR